MKWNSELYDNKHGFVAEYGKGLFEFLPVNPDQAILDLGCGTGTLTKELAGRGSRIVGADASEEMIERARALYPDIEFQVCDALALPFEAEFDVVFSNAVFHWILDHETLVQNIGKVLKPGGMLVCEFGAEGNIKSIETAFAKVCKDFGHEVQSRFNFDSVENFGRILEENGFTIERIYAFDRPTPLNDGADGMRNWLMQFMATDLAQFDAAKQAEIIRQVEGMLKEKLWNGTNWSADQRRLRAIARN